MSLLTARWLLTVVTLDLSFQMAAINQIKTWLLYGNLPQPEINRLQKIPNSFARAVTRTPKSLVSLPFLNPYNGLALMNVLNKLSSWPCLTDKHNHVRLEASKREISTPGYALIRQYGTIYKYQSANTVSCITILKKPNIRIRP